MQKTELPHHTHEQVEGYLRDALALIETLNVPHPLRVHAFVKAVDLLASKQLFFEQPQLAPNLGALLDRH